MIGLTCFIALFAISKAAVLPKIIGGSNTTIEKVPWAVTINVGDYIYCGGSIISPNYILTTASCVLHNDAEEFMIRSGSTFRQEGGTETAVVSSAWNSLFDQLHYDYDIAVLKLSAPLNISDAQKPVSLGLKTVTAGTVGQIAGWGQDDTGFLAKVLQSAEVPVVDQEECAQAYGIYRNVTERMVCAGAVGVDSCVADAGVALTVSGVAVGVSSWGNGCGEPGFPGVYANVAALKEFIDKHSNGEATWV